MGKVSDTSFQKGGGRIDKEDPFDRIGSFQYSPPHLSYRSSLKNE
jgi:hypothetical protein